MDTKLAQLMLKMTEYDRGDVPRIHHFMKVHNLAATIGKLENVSADTLFILEAAAILHDIGIHLSEQKYGYCTGHYQEIEGPAEARMLLKQTGGFTHEQIERIAYLVGHHHTYTNIDGQDYQILVEADFLVNFYEDHIKPETIEKVRTNIFKTKTGREMLDAIYGEQPGTAAPHGQKGFNFC